MGAERELTPVRCQRLLLSFDLPEGAKSFPNRVVCILARRVPHERYGLLSASYPNPIEPPTYLINLIGGGYRACIKPFLVNGCDRREECLHDVFARVCPLTLGVA